MNSGNHEELGAVFRREHGAILASLVAMSGDLDAAEDALQEALLAATKLWTKDGLPANPGGWLMTTSRRRLIDGWRRRTVGASKQELATLHEPNDQPSAVVEDRLSLLFTCCHPALNLESRVVLTLRTICGLTTEEIAASFIVPTSTMAQRIVRAKHKIKVAQISYAVPGPDEWHERLSSVMAAIYLAFNQGYELAADRRGVDLAERAIEIARLLTSLIPDEPEIEGLLALMLLTHSRVHARTTDQGLAILLADQDRSRWNHEHMREAFELIAVAPRHGSVGQYWIQAAIAAEHVKPGGLAERDWHQIVALYDKLLDQTRNSPIVALNRALAVSQLDGPRVALASLNDVEERLDSYQGFHAARAHLLAQAGDDDNAIAAYKQAIALAPPGPQRAALLDALKDVQEISTVVETAAAPIVDSTTPAEQDQPGRIAD